MKRLLRGILAGGLIVGGAFVDAQVPDSSAAAPAPANNQNPPPANKPANSSGENKFLGKDIPIFDPSNEVAAWDGHNWNLNNNRIFEARFEKYLNAPEETTAQNQQYQAILDKILDLLSPEKVSSTSVDEAFRLLPRASGFDVDARLCDALADAVYSVWRAQDASQRLARANEALEQERKANEWNARVASQTVRLEGPPPSKDKEAAAEWAKERQLARDSAIQPYTTRLAEIIATIKTNQAKKELTSLEAKIEFQALFVQLFLQRRFQHVLIGTRFYRAVFASGEGKLEVGSDTKDLFSKSTGMPPTVGTLDALAHEAVRDVRESIQSFHFLLQKNELQSATKRLAEAFSVGEFLPEVRTLPRDDKRRVLDFSQKNYQLISAIEVKDYGLAEKLVKQLTTMAKDFDESKPLAAIETARTVSGMHLAKARNAALSGDKATLETELKEATELWPRNPALADVSALIFSQGDVQQKALVDFDQLISQHNLRQIYDDKLRFIAAAAMYPDRQAQLKKVLDQMQVIETAMIQAGEIEKRGDYAGAWETVEKVFKQNPEDSKLNQMRANLTTEAADFVRTLRTAQQLEDKGEVGSSLAWYLKARRIYPASEFAQEGITRLVAKVLPETSNG
jgi:Rod binding domain-containing protein